MRGEFAKGVEQLPKLVVEAERIRCQGPSPVEDERDAAFVYVCAYVLAAKLEAVAQAASARLQAMSGGRYELYGPYRSPEFPVYGWDSSSLKAGKCRTGWVSFEDGRKAVRIATEVSNSTYTWSASGK